MVFIILELVNTLMAPLVQNHLQNDHHSSMFSYPVDPKLIGIRPFVRPISLKKLRPGLYQNFLTKRSDLLMLKQTNEVSRFEILLIHNMLMYNKRTKVYKCINIHNITFKIHVIRSSAEAPLGVSMRVSH